MDSTLGTVDLAKQLADLESKLHEEFDALVGAAAVTSAAKQSQASLEGFALRNYVAVFAGRRSRQALRQLAEGVQAE